MSCNSKEDHILYDIIGCVVDGKDPYPQIQKWLLHPSPGLFLCMVTQLSMLSCTLFSKSWDHLFCPLLNHGDSN